MRNNDETPSLNAVIGRNVRRLREEAGETQSEFSRRVRGRGIRWNQPTISALEAGNKTLDVGELVLLVDLLGTSTDELLAGAGEVALPAGCSASLPDVRRILAGATDGAVDMPGTPTARQLREHIASLREHHARLWPDARPAQVVKAEDAADGQAELKAARRLHVDPIDLSLAAFSRWGHSLTDERDKRLAAGTANASARTIQALRGHITRQLFEELEPILKREN